MERFTLISPFYFLQIDIYISIGERFFHAIENIFNILTQDFTLKNNLKTKMSSTRQFYLNTSNSVYNASLRLGLYN